MSWKVELGGDKTALLDDLAPEEFQKVADKHDVWWLRLYDAPIRNSLAAYDLLAALCEKAGVDPPDKPDTVKQSVEITLRFTYEDDDDRPKAWDGDGIPPSAGDQETTSSSGLPATSDGPQT